LCWKLHIIFKQIAAHINFILYYIYRYAEKVSCIFNALEDMIIPEHRRTHVRELIA